jgi:hypothetical protein
MIAVLIVFGLFVASCASGNNQTPTRSPGGTQAQISLTDPAAGAVLPTNFVIRGRLLSTPANGQLNYRVIDAREQVLGSGVVAVTGTPGQAGTFQANATYTPNFPGTGRLELYQIDLVNGSTVVLIALRVGLQGATVNLTQPPVQPTTAPNTASPTAATAQEIVIETPPGGTLVGSPVVITGRTARLPGGGRLEFRFFNAAGQGLGVGSFPVSGTPNQPTNFSASLSFNLPPQGGDIRLELYDRNPATGTVNATASLPLFVAPPQAITIETPPPGTTVGSPVVITGRLARTPFQGKLTYRVLNDQGTMIGTGAVAVAGAPGRPTNFVAEVVFPLPLDGGPIQVELLDQSADNTIIARAAIQLRVQPTPQQIVIESPPPGTPIGSPVVITGRTTRFPADGKIVYQLIAADGRQLGQGAFGASARADGGANFKASINFTLPEKGGEVRLQLLDQVSGSGVVLASTTTTLVVTPPGPAPQTLTITSPANGTLVGSPVTITGRAARSPLIGFFQYRVTRANGTVLAEGIIRPSGNAANEVSFNTAIVYSVPGGPISIEIYESDPQTGVVLASASVTLNTPAPVGTPQPTPAGTPQPTPAPTAQPAQQIVIESPAPLTQVGSPMTVVGRVARVPTNNQLSYRVLDSNGAAIGRGQFAVSPVVGSGATFTAEISFTNRAPGTQIRLQVFEVGSNGQEQGLVEVSLQT